VLCAIHLCISQSDIGLRHFAIPARLFASCKLDSCPILKPKPHKINQILDVKAHKSVNRVDRRTGNQENRVPVTGIAGNQEANSSRISNIEQGTSNVEVQLSAFVVNRNPRSSALICGSFSF
jgi:hypothetical protein